MWVGNPKATISFTGYVFEDHCDLGAGSFSMMATISMAIPAADRESHPAIPTLQLTSAT